MENKQEQQKKYPKRGSWRRLTYSSIKIQFYIFLKDVKKAFKRNMAWDVFTQPSEKELESRFENVIIKDTVVVSEEPITKLVPNEFYTKLHENSYDKRKTFKEVGYSSLFAYDSGVKDERQRIIKLIEEILRKHMKMNIKSLPGLEALGLLSNDLLYTLKDNSN